MRLLGDEAWQFLDQIGTLGAVGWVVWVLVLGVGTGIGWFAKHLTNRPIKKELGELRAAISEGIEPDVGPVTSAERFAALAPALRNDLERVSGQRSSEKRVYWLFKLQRFEVFPPPVWEHRLWGMFAPAVLVSMESADLDGARQQGVAIMKKMMDDALRDNRTLGE